MKPKNLRHLRLNWSMTEDRKHRSTNAANEAKRQNLLEPFELSPVEPRELTPYEISCMEGHTIYLQMIESGEIISGDQPSHLVQEDKKSRGILGENLNLGTALAEFETQGGSMRQYCKLNYRRFGYRTLATMYLAFRHRRLTALD